MKNFCGLILSLAILGSFAATSQKARADTIDLRDRQGVVDPRDLKIQFRLAARGGVGE